MYRIHIDEAGRNGGRNRGRHRFLPSERLMSKVLSEQTIALVKATVPALQAHGLDIVRAMYARMFRNPTIRDLFNQSHHRSDERRVGKEGVSQVRSRWLPYK